MVVEVLDPNTAPFWLNVIIWMGVFWQYILVAFIPGFYIAITWLFGFPLLQRWQQEVVIMLYPTKVKFGKITQQYEPYFRHKKGVYWLGNPLQPIEHRSTPPKIQDKMNVIKERYELLVSKEQKTKKEELEIARLLRRQVRLEKQIMSVSPVNQIHVYTHAVNQSIYRMERRESKVDEILNNDARPKKIHGHNIWIMQNPKLHFHRHYQIIIDPSGTLYTLIPVKERQQFSIGFWHSLGVIMQKEVEGIVPIEEDSQREIEVSGGRNGKQLIQTTITTNIILEHMKEVQDFQNFSATRAFQLLKRRARIEDNFMFWIKGTFDMRILLVIVGAVAGIALIMVFGLQKPEIGTPPT